MQYLILGLFLLFGALTACLFLFFFHLGRKVEVTVLESGCELVRDGELIEKIIVGHTLQLQENEEIRTLKTEALPVCEMQGTKRRLCYDAKTKNIYLPDYRKYAPMIGGFALCGIFCLVLYFLRVEDFLRTVTGEEWLAVLFGTISLVSFSQACVIFQPALIRCKGQYEGLLQTSSDFVEVYGLWYGEHKQYAKRKQGMCLRTRAEEPVRLLFHTKTGQVYRLHEIVFSVCIGTVFLLAMLALFV